ncbi:legume-specific protein [Spatholobus suberectus]|nr:legume-specific protein [Spatholobus suberectus]
MEGLIPVVYKAIMQYKSGKEGAIGSWICESPSYSYMRLPGDSGRFQTPASFSAPSPSSNNAASSATQIIVSSGVQSPHQCLTHRRIAA